MKKNWKTEIKNKMEAWQEPVPDGLWSDLCAIQGLVPQYKEGKRSATAKFFIVSAIAAAFFILAAGTIFLIYYPEEAYNKEDIVASVETTYHESIPDVIIKDFHDDREKMFNGQEIHIEETKKIHHAYGCDTKKDIVVIQDAEKHEDKSSINSDENRNHHVVSTTENAECDLTLVPEYMMESVKASRKRRFSISASITGTPGRSEHISGYGDTFAESTVESFGLNPSSDLRLFNRTREVSTDSKYMQPIRAGVTIRWYISDRWSIESGLVWSWLHSGHTSGSEQYYCRTKQDLHYIGIPVRTSYDFWKGRNIRTYISAEAMAEKCISGRAVSHYIYNSKDGPDENIHIREKQLQWSVSATAGLQYDINDTVGIYAEPGISWHFENGSHIENIYKARPLNISLGLGLRFSF